MNPRDLQASVYDELRKVAEAKLALENPGMSFTATALVHEAWIKLVRWNKECVDRTHFLRTAARAMKQILIDHARSSTPVLHIGLPDVAASERPEDFIALDEALKKLAAEKPNYAELIELRYLAGATNDEAAEAMGITSAVANHQCRYARAWLKVELKKGDRQIPAGITGPPGQSRSEPSAAGISQTS